MNKKLSSNEMQRLLTQQGKVINMLWRSGDLARILIEKAKRTQNGNSITLEFPGAAEVGRVTQLLEAIEKSEALAGPSITQRAMWFSEAVKAIQDHLPSGEVEGDTYPIPRVLIGNLLEVQARHLIAEQPRTIEGAPIPTEVMEQ